MRVNSAWQILEVAVLFTLPVVTAASQAAFSASTLPAVIDHPAYPPRINYAALDHEDDGRTPPPSNMHLHPLHVSGNSAERVDLTFFSDGYTPEEENKFIADAEKLTRDIISPDGAMGHVQGLINVWGVFVPSNISGIGTHDTPNPGAAFGLYRPGPELRGVYVQHHRRVRAACTYWREGSVKGGCDQAIILGNDPLYGGLGGEFTIITASELNGPLVLRHELGHSLIPVGEEYEGGFAYFGVNSDKMSNLEQLSWKKFLTNPDDVRIEDVRVPLQAYPWHNLTTSSYQISFNSSNTPALESEPLYPSALLRLSLSSIPYPSHITFNLNSKPLNLSTAFSPAPWKGSRDRRWLEIPLDNGLPAGQNMIEVALTAEGRGAEEGQGGKMITSLEIMEYGGDGRFNSTKGLIGAFPTYAENGGVTLRPMNEECLMRKVNHPTFCPVCAAGLESSLRGKIERKRAQARS